MLLNFDTPWIKQPPDLFRKKSPIFLLHFFKIYSFDIKYIYIFLFQILSDLQVSTIYFGNPTKYQPSSTIFKYQQSFNIFKVSYQKTYQPFIIELDAGKIGTGTPYI